MPGGGDSETVSRTELSDEQKALLGLAMPLAQKYAKNPLQLFPGSVIPGFNRNQQEARRDMLRQGRQIGNLADDGIGGARRGMDLAGDTAGLGSSLAGGAGFDLLRDYRRQAGGRDLITSGDLLDPDSNPATKGMIRAATRPIEQRLTRSILPGVRSDFVGGNTFGSSRQGIAEGIAMGDYARAATDAGSQIVNNNYNQGLSAMVSGLNAGTSGAAAGGGLGASLAGTGLGNMAQIFNTLPGLSNLSLLPGMTQEAIGQSQYNQQGARLGERADRFNIRQMLPFMQAQQLAGLAFGMPGGSGVTSTNNNPSVGSQVAGGIGTLGTLLLMGSMFSDTRLKKDIRFVRNDGKYNWYEFKYQNSDEVREGVLAQEIAEIMPEAVEVIGGFYAVDYGRLQ